jgi:hypothetical protein
LRDTKRPAFALVRRHRFADYGRQVVNLEPRLIHAEIKPQKSTKSTNAAGAFVPLCAVL